MTTKENEHEPTPRQRRREAQFATLYAIELEETRKQPRGGAKGALSPNDPEVPR